MELRELRYLVQIAKDHSYTKAATHLFVSQPALSKMMKKLEAEMKVPLLERRTNGIYLTDYGEQFYQKAVTLINEFDDLENFAKDVRESKVGKLCIGATPMLGTLFLVDIFVDFCNLYPGVELKLEEGGSKFVRQQVLAGNNDIGLCIAGDENELLSEKILFRDTIVACVHKSNPLAKRKSLRFEDLMNESFNFYSNASTLHTQIADRCVRAGFQPKINVISSKISMVMQLTIRNRGICLLPRPYAERYTSEEIKMLPLEDAFPWCGCLIKRKASYQPYISKLFESFVEDYFKKYLAARPNNP